MLCLSRLNGSSFQSITIQSTSSYTTLWSCHFIFGHITGFVYNFNPPTRNQIVSYAIHRQKRWFSSKKCLRAFARILSSTLLGARWIIAHSVLCASSWRRNVTRVTNVRRASHSKADTALANNVRNELDAWIISWRHMCMSLWVYLQNTQVDWKRASSSLQAIYVVCDCRRVYREWKIRILLCLCWNRLPLFNERSFVVVDVDAVCHSQHVG